MDISVVMSVYKSEKADYLDRALQSVWTDQTLKPKEIVLVIDGEIGDELRKVVNDWKDKLQKSLIIHQTPKNLGLTKSLNIAIGLSSGDLIARMDSDDISIPNRFEKQVAYLMSNKSISVVGGAIQEFSSSNPCLKVRHYPQNMETIRNYICKASPLAHPSVMMRREIFDVIKYNERYRMSQDIALWYDALCAGFLIGNIDDVILLFRREGDVYKRRGKKKAFNEFRIYINGIRRYYGLFTWRYIYAFSRVSFRLMPTWIIKRIYDSKARQKMLTPKTQ